MTKRKRRPDIRRRNRPGDELGFHVVTYMQETEVGEINVKALARELRCSRQTVIWHASRELPEKWAAYRAYQATKGQGA